MPCDGAPDHELRRRLADRYLRGDGIEIGPLHQPLAVPEQARVRYVDRLGLDDLRRHYPDLAEHDLVEPDIIDDGERLATMPDESVDFVVANHFIEHCQDPIGALRNHLRVLRPGGVLYMAVPDKRHTFDRERPITPLEHVVRDHEEGPAWSLREHLEEWVRVANNISVDVDQHVESLLASGYSIHYHVWTPEPFRELLDYCRTTLLLPFEVEIFREAGFEFIAILRKT